LSWIFKFLTGRWLFNQQKGDITTRQSDSMTISMKIKPHELDKLPSRYLNWGNYMFRLSASQMIQCGNSSVEILGLMDYHLILMYHIISQTSWSTTKDNVFVRVANLEPNIFLIFFPFSYFFLYFYFYFYFYFNFIIDDEETCDHGHMKYHMRWCHRPRTWRKEARRIMSRCIINSLFTS